MAQELISLGTPPLAEDGDTARQAFTKVNANFSEIYANKADTASLGSAAFTAATDYATSAQGALAESAVQPGDLGTAAFTSSDDYAAQSDPRLTDAREWTAETVPQAEAEAGTATTRRAWTAQRVRQAVAAWWLTVTSSFGRGLVAAADAANGRAALSVREALTASRTYYVRVDGNDSNNGLANTAGGAFLTIQRAVDVAASLDLGIFNCTIQVADGIYSGAVVLKGAVGSGQVQIIGNEATPASVIITGGGVLVSGVDFGRYLLAGVTVASTGSGNIRASGRSELQYRNIISQGSATLGTHLDASNYGRILAVGPITLNGNSQIGFSGNRYGVVFISTQQVIFAAGTTITARGFQGDDQGRVDMYNVTFSGSFTGKRYALNGLGAIFTNGAGETYIPGSSSGTSANGGIYY